MGKGSYRVEFCGGGDGGKQERKRECGGKGSRHLILRLVLTFVRRAEPILMEVEVGVEEFGVDLCFRIGARRGRRDNRMMELFYLRKYGSFTVVRGDFIIRLKYPCTMRAWHMGTSYLILTLSQNIPHTT